jgi:hypothetical protein
MKKLNKHLLKYEFAKEFFEDTLIDANTLSNELLNVIDFTDGYFFTLLPENANLENLYKFTTYGILPQNPTIEYLVNEQMSTYTEIPTIVQEIGTYIFEYMILNNINFCIFDDVTRMPNDRRHPTLFSTNGFFLKQEIYYIINKNDISEANIREGLKLSNSFWHSLCILSNATIVDLTNRNLIREKLKEASEKTKVVIVEAYDGEGFIFWEKGTEAQFL